jgi:hypothetical protein
MNSDLSPSKSISEALEELAKIAVYKKEVFKILTTTIYTPEFKALGALISTDATYSVVLTTFDFTNLIISMEPVGSRVTCNPPPKDTDEDILVLVEDREEVIKTLVKAGFKKEGAYITGDTKFISLRRGETNFIVTDDKAWYEKFLLATAVCKELNVMKKEHRCCVFAAILEGKFIP